MLYDIDGARSPRPTATAGRRNRQEAYFVDAFTPLDSTNSFQRDPPDTGGYRFFYYARIHEAGDELGVSARSRFAAV